jgi:hypothetical protein
MAKQQVELKWHGEKAQPIERAEAARIIRGNRRQRKELRINVFRKHGDTYIVSDFLNVACCIGPRTA